MFIVIVGCFTKALYVALSKKKIQLTSSVLSNTQNPDIVGCAHFQDGKVAQLEHVFIRGSKVRFMIIPDMLKNAPMFKRLEARIKGKGSALDVGRGRALGIYFLMLSSKYYD
ncbi:unnamed protein product [Lactuca virosa]|uniref:Uncharacterized protein n=1 Tax=Lactuca virosa TaxID=75947 RepID=A0AAU9MV81_9ASTR|nr:unnamed protein product [Lactuca virosa]